MPKVVAYMRQGHGTEARARRHYRDGDKPLRKFCVPCAETVRQAWIRRNADKREKQLADVQ